MKRKPKVLSIILAGGRVDELNVLTAHRPKSAVPFGGFARVIDFPLSNLMQSGLELVAILSQYRSFSLISHIGIGAAWDMIGSYRGVSILPPYQGFGQSSWYRGSADAVFQNLDFIQFHNPETILILSGDHVYHMDYREILAYHREKDADLTIGCVEVPFGKAHRFGVAEINDEDGPRGGRVLQYQEKPADPCCNWASMTIYCFKPRVLYEMLAINAHEDESFEFGRNIIPRLMAAKHRVYGYKFRGYWGYTRTIDEYWQTSMDLLGPDQKVRVEEWGIRTNLDHRRTCDCQPLKVGSAATIDNSLVYNGCTVEGAVHNSILFPGVHVKAGAMVRDSVLFFNNAVGRDCRLDKVVSDVNVTFGNGARIGKAGAGRVTVVGWNNIIPDKMIIGQGCTLYPGLAPEQLARPTIPAGEVVR